MARTWFGKVIDLQYATYHQLVDDGIQARDRAGGDLADAPGFDD
ncbi:MAG: hypothetical protein WBN51_10470 [Gammaproteobacteria bacterium]